MRHYKVTFIVTAEGDVEALAQAEKYLNTGGRVVDCDVDPRPVDRRCEPGLPIPAPYLLEVGR